MPPEGQGLSVESVTLDVTNADQIAAVGADIQSRFGRLDILVNNAGVLLDDVARKPSEQTLACWRETFETSVFAVVQVTQALLPLLRAAPAGRIVNVSSQLGSLGWHTDPASPIYNFKIPAYDASKSVVKDGARSSVQMALLGHDGPSGTFTHLGKTLPW